MNQRMPKTIISDTSCFIILTNIGELDLLNKLYGEIITTGIIAEEYGKPLPAWVTIVNPTEMDFNNMLKLTPDRGEASAIALALEIKDCVLIVDDYKARVIAVGLGIEIKGTIGVIVSAKLHGIIPSIKPVLEKIRNTNFRLSEEIELIALQQAGEIFP
jgi:predicted nucleic acid-binding protein